jgi:hypothetical protein
MGGWALRWERLCVCAYVCLYVGVCMGGWFVCDCVSGCACGCG